MISGIQLEHRVDALVLVKGLDLLCIFLNCFQDWIAGLGLLVPQREIDAVWLALRLVGEDVFLETWKPQGTGHTPHPGEHICPVDSVQGEQTSQRVPGDPTPCRRPGELFLCPGYDLLHQ